MVCFLLFVAGFHDRSTLFNLVFEPLVFSKHVLGLFDFLILLVASWDDVEEGLVVNGQDTVGCIYKAIEGQHTIVWRSYNIIVVWRKNTSRKLEDRWVKVGQVLQDVGAKTWTSSTSERMQKEEALQTVALLNLLPHTLFDFLLIFRTILHVSLGPIITRTRSNLVRDSLSRIENILEFTTEDFLVNDTTFHIDNNCASF